MSNVSVTPVHEPSATLTDAQAAVFVYHIDLFIIGAFALYVLFVSPRAFARFSQSGEWTQGLFLRSVRLNANGSGNQHRPPALRNQSSSSIYPMTPVDPSASNHFGNGTEDSHTLYAHQPPQQLAKPTSRQISKPNQHHTYPAHLPSSYPLPAFRTLACILRKRVAPGFSLNQLVICVIYFGILSYASLYKSSPFTDPVRTGFVAVSQIPFLFALAAKNNVLGCLIGFGYEKVHIATFLPSVIHIL